MRPHLSILLALVIAMPLSACSVGKEIHFRKGKPQLVADPDNVSAMLADAADRAATSLEQLAAVEQSRSPGVAVAPVSDAPLELRRAVTVNWVGPVEPLVKNLADRTSYNFVVVGATPPVPVVISLDVENKPVIEALRDIGLQMGLRADIRIDGNSRSIEIHYAPVTGIGS